MHVLSVFVASPGDVEAERSKLEEVIREHNETWSRELGVRLELVRWETHSFPGIGADAQDVINDQIPDDYDLFIGIMWCRYGTPTGRAGSGTAEEFDRAKARYENDPNSVKLMVYFKDEPVPPSQLDVRQFEKVSEFRASLGDEGVLFWNFDGLEKFEKLIRIHLARQIQAWKNRSSTAVITPIHIDEQESHSEVGDDDDEGILDLIVMFEDKFVELRESLERMAAANDELNRKMADETAQLRRLPRTAQGNANPRDARRHIAKVSSDMRTYIARIEADLPLFKNAANEGMNSLIKAITMSVDTSSGNNSFEAEEALHAVEGLRGSLAASKENLITFRDTIASLPRMTTDLNRSKRGVTNVLDNLLVELVNVEALLTESEKAIHDLPGS